MKRFDEEEETAFTVGHAVVQRIEATSKSDRQTASENGLIILGFFIPRKRHTNVVAELLSFWPIKNSLEREQTLGKAKKTKIRSKIPIQRIRKINLLECFANLPVFRYCQLLNKSDFN